MATSRMRVSKPLSRSDPEHKQLKPVLVSLIVAMTPSRVIGRDGGLPWHLSADLKHFKATTMGKPIIMGRKTFESIGRPLPGRRNIVVTRNRSFKADGVSVVNSLDDALSKTDPATELMIIGGAQLYELALPLADRIYLTHILADIDGDTFFPAPDWSNWRLVSRSASQIEQGIRFNFCRYHRIPRTSQQK